MTDDPELIHGITVVSGTEDFSQWNWGDPPEKTEVRAANVVLKELIEQAYIDLDISDGIIVARFDTFEGNVLLSRPLSAMLDQWIDDRRARDGKIHGADREESVILIGILEAATELLRQELA